jgi:glyoxylase-like metal-dependent hydrolase (beta-lactamase superfamily II)
MKIAENLYRLGNDIVAAYFVVTEQGITVIDAGLPGHYSDLKKELSSIGKSLSDVRGVILTHGDGDHIGFAERLRREHGVPVFIHSADADRAKGGPKPKTGSEPMKLGGVLSFFGYAMRKGGMRTHYLTEVTEIAEGQILPLPGSPVVIGMPGHSPGSIAVHVPSVDAVFVGDALTTRHVLTGEVGPAPAPFTDEPERARESLSALAATGATWVLPGHGPVWGEGVDAAIEAITAH